MNQQSFLRAPRLLLTSLALAALSSAAFAVDVPVSLTGEQEVPPVKTSATGNGMFAIAADNTIAGSISTKGVNGTAAHIHEGAAGKRNQQVRRDARDRARCPRRAAREPDVVQEPPMRRVLSHPLRAFSRRV